MAADQAAVELGRLKPLVWQDSRMSSCTETGFGRYEVGEFLSLVRGAYFMWSFRRGVDEWKPCDSIDHGKELCWQDYRRRVAALFD